LLESAILGLLNNWTTSSRTKPKDKNQNQNQTKEGMNLVTSLPYRLKFHGPHGIYENAKKWSQTQLENEENNTKAYQYG